MKERNKDKEDNKEDRQQMKGIKEGINKLNTRKKEGRKKNM